ncbi:septum formation family protein [Agromyces albus]|uniref:septum formation family protein n=1 Tax=Agromyces albus TaxID=205332 RepID=UPI00278265CF|nr:septum formation family protein [Agromyces albus]MDQ0576768.1 gamma-glutamylcyclotransferase (GGCT)/AIG2-like uncharacterized protein YtfP [Agromyces albus]
MAGVAAVAVTAIGVFVGLPRNDAPPAPATTSTDSTAVRVFTYGSSMPGESRYGEIKEYVESSTRAVVEGLLYDSGLGYPAAKFEPGGEIPGFVLTLDPDTADAFMREQTALESGLFAPVTVQTQSGVSATAWEWIGATDGMPRIDAWDGSTAEYGQAVDIRALSVGDCFTNSDGRTALTVWCDAPHGYETLHVESLPAAPYSVDAIDATAAERCDDAFTGKVGERADASELAIERFLPSREEWESGDRVVLCAVYKPGALLEGTLDGG